MSYEEDVDPTVGELVSRVAFAVGEQAGLHVELQVQLVRAELEGKVNGLWVDAVGWLRASAPVVLGGALVLLGYLSACLAVVLALVPWIGAAGGVAFVAIFNGVFGGLLLRRGTRSVRPTKGTTHARS
jgi:hypothetical protein